MSNPIKRAVKQTLQKAGYALQPHSPYLLQHPENELFLSFPLVVAHHALRALSASDPFFFIQVGAFDGVKDDPLNEFIRRLNWHGILIEPQSAPFSLLQKTYADLPHLHLVRAAVSDSDGTKPFYTVRQDIEGVPDITQRLASFRKEVILNHKYLYADIENAIKEEQIQTTSFSTILNTYGVEKLDLLQIDAEGYDFEILKMFPFDRIKPAVVHYEHKHLKDDMEASWVYLAERGYLLGVHGADTTAYRKDLCPAEVA